MKSELSLFIRHGAAVTACYPKRFKPLNEALHFVIFDFILSQIYFASHRFNQRSRVKETSFYHSKLALFVHQVPILYFICVIIFDNSDVCFHVPGWWFDACGPSNLNGMYYQQGQNSNRFNGIKWYYWKGSGYSLKSTTMMIRPADFTGPL